VLFGVDIAADARCRARALYAGFAGLSTTINTPATDRAYRGLMGAESRLDAPANPAQMVDAPIAVGWRFSASATHEPVFDLSRFIACTVSELWLSTHPFPLALLQER